MKKFFTICIMLFCFWGLSAIAQNLPKIQTVSLRAPTDIKIDGKATEWNNQFQAFNKATDIFYTISNDDENLYLTVQAKDPEVINKIIGGGVSLTIQLKANKKSNNKFSITYPEIDSKSAIIFSLRPLHYETPDTTLKTADSIMMLHNKLLRQKCKWIGINGITGVDSLLSVYNNEGIKAVGLFDNKKVYTIEMSVSLKQLLLSVDNKKKFNYNIRVNGIKQASELFGSAPAILIQKNAEENNKQAAATDFWGEYTLAKK